MTTGNPDNVSVLVQSCDTGLTTFITKTASPTVCFAIFLPCSDILEAISVNYHRISMQRCGSSRDIINVV